MQAISEVKILAVLDSHNAPFMDDDVKILRSHFSVDTIYRTDYPRIRYLLLEVARRFLRHRPGLIYCWFVMPWDTAAIVFMTRLMGVKSVLHVGGYDVANIPELEYGMMRWPQARPWTRFALNWANLVNASSEFSMGEVYHLAHPRCARVIYPGVDMNIFRPGNREKQDLVITIGTVGRGHLRIKGLETFARCSKIVPQTEFVIIGRVADDSTLEHLKGLGGKNLHFTSAYATREEIVDWCQRAKVYVQASARESFGLAVAEAMACECVPVVTRVAALPEVVGDTGFYTAYGDVEGTVEAIKQALESPNGPAARRRVLENFTLAHREERLLTEVHRLLA